MEEKERYSYDYFIDGAVFIDTENDRDMDMDTVCSLLNKQDKRIKELEDEKKVGEFWHSAYQGKQLEYDMVYAELRKTLDENQQLKQQLHDLPKKIMGDITNELSNNTSLYFEMRESTSVHCPNKEYEWFNYVRFRNYINAILKKYGGEDDTNKQ